MGTVKYEVGDYVKVDGDWYQIGEVAYRDDDYPVYVPDLWDPWPDADQIEGHAKSKPAEPSVDPINPAHYRAGRVQVIEVSRLMGFDVGNAVKYLARAGKKDPSRELEDLRKAEWYLTDAVEHCEVADWDDAPEDLDDAVDAIVEGLTYLRAKAIKHAVEAELEDALECVRRELARLEGK